MRVLWQRSRTILRSADETENDFARRINLVAESLRQQSFTEQSGRHPKIVVHFSESRTEAIVNCTVVW